VDPVDNSFSLGPKIVNDNIDICGQLKHVSGFIKDTTFAVGNTITTGQPGGTTTWVAVKDSANQRYAIRTGGVLPTGFAPGAVSFTSGNAANHAAFYGALDVFLGGVGWTVLGDPGVWTDGRAYFSTGEDGAENIYAAILRNSAATDEFYAEVWDDALRTHKADSCGYLDNTDFPANYWVTADKDEINIVFQRGLNYTWWYMGKGYIFAPGLPDTTYRVVAAHQGHGVGLAWGCEVLREHQAGAGAAWGQAGYHYTSTYATNSNPNPFDGVSYLVWPKVFYHNHPTAGVGNYVPVSQPKYCGFSSGGGLANLDTITSGTEVWTAFFDSTAKNFMLRTA